MISQQPKQKGFFAKYWGLILGIVAVAGIVLVAAGILLYMFVIRGNAKVTDLGLSTDTVVYGKKLEAVVKVENSGLMSYEYHASLLVDGVEAASQDITLESKNPQALNLDISGLKPGQHTIKIGDKEKSFKVLKPAEFKVSDLMIKQDIVVAGDTITVSAKVSNLGEVEDKYTATFTYDGAGSDPVEVTVGPGGEETVEAQLSVKNKGKHTVGIEDLKLAIEALTPAQISVTGLKLSKVYAKPSEAVTVTVSLENTGDIAGKISVELLVNDTADQVQDVSVDGKGKAVHTFTLSQAKTGKYTIKSGDKSQMLYVVTITRPANGTFLIKTAKANTTRGSLGYMQIYNDYSDKDAMFVLTTRDKPKAAVLAVFVRAGQSVLRFYVKNTSYYLGYYTAGGNFDSSSRRFLVNPEYFKATDFINFDKYWYHFFMPAKYYNKISEADFPK